jgi:hypothetical protein
MMIIITQKLFFEISVYIAKTCHTRWDFRPPSVALPQQTREKGERQKQTQKHQHPEPTRTNPRERKQKIKKKDWEREREL